MQFEGWLGDLEADILFSISAGLTGAGCIVEIGSWCAKSLSVITAGAIKGGFKNKIYSIDPFLTSKDEPNGKYETFFNNLTLNGIENRITHIKEKSQIAGQNFNDKIEFIFIDGFHKYEAVKKDFELFYPKVLSGGYIAIHDVQSYLGPAKILCDVLANDNLSLKLIKIVQQSAILQRVDFMTKEDKSFNHSVLNNFNDFLKEKGHLLNN